MSAPPKVRELAELFRRNADAYHAPQYNEAMVRQEFINPLFKCLGWDMDNEQGYAEAYKDVIHEAAIKIGGATKAPDYCFRIGGAAKFFLEAKRPSVRIKDDPDPAYQLRRYAWTGKLSLSVLTDFEEFAVYDCCVKPAHTDKAGVARILYLRYDDYPERWDEIAGIFSREAILKGSFDKFAESNKAKRGTAAVDTAFLQEIENWRDMLARNLALRNPHLGQRELNYAVQVTIDRIIFLRMCEDRGIEPYGQLQKLMQEPDIYQNLLDLYRKADDRYNSGLFHFHTEKGRPEAPDTLTPSLTLDDKPLKDILHGLYYPECPYEFSVLSGEILGQVYEQFLGKVIRLTAGHQAKVEDKPEVRKAGGVYYTPTYIVDYIVKQTVGKLLGEPGASTAGLTPKQAAKLRIIDPACGSGSFLLGAFQLLLDWHRDYYVKAGPRKHTKELYQGAGGVWRLTTAEKKRILLANIHGVDIDPQAVEVTKLSLLLKVLEGESEQTLQSQLRMFHERALPDLSSNIQCGNSLIGPDFYDGQQMDLFDEEERYRINVFDWHAAFPWLREAGGFDVVIGNPPWGADFSVPEQAFLRNIYETAKGSNIDSYAVFIERALRQLKLSGILGFITPDTYLRKNDHLLLRKLILEKTCIVELIETGPVFSKVRDTWCLIQIVEKTEPTSSSTIGHRKISRFIVSAEDRLSKFAKGEWDQDAHIPQSRWRSRPNMIVGYLASVIDQDLIAKIELQPKLAQQKNTFSISRGEEGSKFNVQEAADGDFFMVTPKDVERHAVAPGIRVSGSGLTPSKLKSIYVHPKIWIIRIQKMRWKQRLVCAFDARRNSAGMKTLQVVTSPSDKEADLKYLSAILASSVMNYWCINYLADDMNQSYLEKIPIPAVESINGSGNTAYARTVDFVEQMLSLHKQLAAAKTPQEQTVHQRQIDATDRQIDRLVYELYGLTDAEIEMVEAANA
ncbi:MAG: Eco57I restriction-modification methylase domain-containing protein [Gemmataceae bacterium]